VISSAANRSRISITPAWVKPARGEKPWGLASLGSLMVVRSNDPEPGLFDDVAIRSCMGADGGAPPDDDPAHHGPLAEAIERTCIHRVADLTEGSRALVPTSSYRSLRHPIAVVGRIRGCAGAAARVRSSWSTTASCASMNDLHASAASSLSAIGAPNRAMMLSPITWLTVPS